MQSLNLKRTLQTEKIGCGIRKGKTNLQVVQKALEDLTIKPAQGCTQAGKVSSVPKKRIRF